MIRVIDMICAMGVFCNTIPAKAPRRKEIDIKDIDFVHGEGSRGR